MQQQHPIFNGVGASAPCPFRNDVRLYLKEEKGGIKLYVVR
jgi:hypothetical protein